jgi:hypothetical protein
MVEANAVEGPDLEKLKASFGKVFKVAFSDTDVFYVRRLKRQEHLRIMAMVANLEKVEAQNMAEEKICEAAIVWPQLPVDFPSTSPTGYIPIIAAQILMLSGFTQDIVVTEV